MAQAIVSPENLAQAVEEIKECIGGSRDFVHIYSVISRKDFDQSGNKIHRLYLALPLDFDITGITLKFARNNKVKYRKINVSDSHRKTMTGWHQILDPRQEGHVLFDNLRLKTPNTNEWTNNWHDKRLYEVTVGNYDSFAKYLLNDNDAQNSGYYKDETKQVEIPLVTFLAKPCGIALVRDGKLISNYARFSGYVEDNVLNLRRY